jgi:hypothetical protein
MEQELITILGREMTLHEAVNFIYKNLQELLNNCHSGTRHIIMLNDDDSAFKTSHELSSNILDFTFDLKLLLTELDKVLKKIPFKPEDSDEREWLKSFLEDRKNMRKERNGSEFK